MSPENNTPTSNAVPPSTEMAGPPTGEAYDLPPPVESAPEMITIPPQIQEQINAQHEAAGTQPTEAYVPSREPVAVESRAIPLTDAQVASMSEAGAVKAAEFGGAEPAEALEARSEAINREAAVAEVAAAQRIAEVSPIAEPPVSEEAPSIPEPQFPAAPGAPDHAVPPTQLQ